MSDVPHTAPRAPVPLLWASLILPYGALSGFVGTVVAFMASEAGMDPVATASLAAAGMLPHTWKFLWAPVVDMTLGRRRWYLGSLAVLVLGMVLTAATPLEASRLLSLQALIFATNLASTTLGMAVEGLMTHHTPLEQRGRAGGWFQAGNLGGAGLGGGAGLWLAKHLPSPTLAALVLAAIFAACALPLFLVADAPGEGEGRSVGEAVRGGLRELLGIVRSREGALAALICFLPIGTGAAAGVMCQAAVAKQWGAGEVEVGTVNGVASGLIMAAGSLLGGEICRRFRPRDVYAFMGALMAVVALVMSFAPLTPTTFIVGGLAYALVTGLSFAAFTGLVLQTIEGGSAATKYNIYASLSNIPITYMGLAMAKVVDVRGPVWMLWAEALAGLGGIALFLVVVAIFRPRTATAPAA